MYKILVDFKPELLEAQSIGSNTNIPYGNG
jgi:hypothetical protein